MKYGKEVSPVERSAKARHEERETSTTKQRVSSTGFSRKTNGTVVTASRNRPLGTFVWGILPRTFFASLGF